MSSTELHVLAHELMTARVRGEPIAVPPSAYMANFDLAAAYLVEAELARMRQARGHLPVGYKVGFANKAIWRALGLDTLVWAHMYDDTVARADANQASQTIAGMCAPKIEPEIVFRMRRPLKDSTSDPAAVLDAVESIALGFEIIDCPYPNWKFQPADFVATFGFHAALIVGEARPVDHGNIPLLIEQLAEFKVRLMKERRGVAEGSGRNALRSPALCLDELAAAMRRAPAARPLAAGDFVSSGTLTDSQPLAAGETWTAIFEGIDLPALTLRT